MASFWKRAMTPKLFVKKLLEIFSSEANPVSAIKLGILLEEHEDFVLKESNSIGTVMVEKCLFVHLYGWLSVLLKNTAFEEPLRKTRVRLYDTLRDIAIGSEAVRKQLTEAYIPALVAKDLCQIHNDYTDNQVYALPYIVIHTYGTYRKFCARM